MTDPTRDYNYVLYHGGCYDGDREIIPSCPPACVWRETCSTGTQQGIRQLWDEGRITQPAECIFFARRARLHFDTTGCGVPGSLEELRQQLATHKAAGPA